MEKKYPHAKFKSNFIRHLHVWKNFTVRSGEKSVAEPKHRGWWLPTRSNQRKRWFEDQSKMALEWADRPYELDYSNVENRRAFGY